MLICKTTQTRVALFEAFVAFYAFAAGSAASDSPASLVNLAAFTRLAIPSLAIALVLLFRNAHTNLKERAQTAVFLDIALSFAAAIVSQVILAILKPEFLLPDYRFTRGAVIAWLFFAALRAWFPHRHKASREIQSQTPITMERLRWNATQFEIRIRQWSSWGNLAAGAAIGLFALGLPFAGGPRVPASGIFIVGAVYVAWIIHKRGAPGAAPLGGGWNEYTRYCRTELQHQSRLLHRLWHWYFGSLIPGVLLLLQGSTIYGCFILTYVLLLGELNYRAIEWIHLEMARIDSPQNSPRRDGETLDIAPQS